MTINKIPLSIINKPFLDTGDLWSNYYIKCLFTSGIWSNNYNRKIH